MTEERKWPVTLCGIKWVRPAGWTLSWAILPIRKRQLRAYIRRVDPDAEAFMTEMASVFGPFAGFSWEGKGAPEMETPREQIALLREIERNENVSLAHDELSKMKGQLK